MIVIENTSVDILSLVQGSTNRTARTDQRLMYHTLHADSSTKLCKDLEYSIIQIQTEEFTRRL